MSTAYFIVLDQEEVPFDTFVNGKFLAQEAETINALCRQIGLKDLDDYTCMNPEELAEWMDNECGEAEDLTPEEEKWFSPDNGLNFIMTLKNYIENHPQSVKNAVGIISDLNEFIQVLTNAVETNTKFHFQIDI